MDFHVDNGLEFYAKVFVALTGLIATFLKLKETLSAVKRKQELKLDLEIYELLKRSTELEARTAKESIEKKLALAFNTFEEGLTNFFIGLTVFIGFGLWSVDIYQSSISFNGWIILTAICSVTGLSMMLGGGKTEVNKKVFYKIGFFDKRNFQFGFIVCVVMGVLLPILLVKIDGFSFWQFFTGLFFIIGVRSIVQNIKRIE
jgi:hypothetical protein